MAESPPSPSSPSASLSGLSLLVLALLREHPMHIYGLHRLIRDRGLDRHVNVQHRNSVRQAVDRLNRGGFIEVDDVQQDSGPARTIYRITPYGSTSFTDALRDMVAHPRREFPSFPVAASLLAFLEPTEVVALCKERRTELVSTRTELETLGTPPPGLPEILFVENDLERALVDAEITWIDRLAARITDGELQWDPAVLLETSPMKQIIEE